MRIALCVKRDLYGLIAARAFTSALALPKASVAVFCSLKTRPVEEASPWLGLLKILERDLPMEVLQSAPLPDAPLPDAPLSDPLGSAEAALRRPWQPLTDLRAEGGGAQLLGWKPDLVVSMRFSLIFPRRIIEAVPRGILNVHPGALPRYRGLFAPFWQAVQEESVLVSSVHRVDAGIDTGPVLAEHAVPRDPTRSLMWHIGELYRGGARLAAGLAMRRLGGEMPPGRPQPPEGRYWSYPADAEIAAFGACGMPLFTVEDYRALLAEALGASDLAAGPAVRAA